MSDEPAPYTNLEHHDRIEFQVDRLILFTDAVFAIAITLLAIELKVPELKPELSHTLGGGWERAAWEGLLALLPKFMGFLVGFFVIAAYWVAHHRLFRFVRHYDDRLLWLNIFFLLGIVLMPFTSGYFSEYIMLDVPYLVYAGSVILTGLLQMRMQQALRDPRRGYLHPADLGHPDLDPLRPFLVVAVFALAIALTLLFPHGQWTRAAAALIFPCFLLYGRRYRRLRQQWAIVAPEPEPAE